jgi:hypothetical protein
MTYLLELIIPFDPVVGHRRIYPVILSSIEESPIGMIAICCVGIDERLIASIITRPSRYHKGIMELAAFQPFVF